MHITVTESLGPALGAIALAVRFPYSPILVQGDASAAHAFVLGRSDSSALQQIYLLWIEVPGVADFLERAAGQHIAGRANTFDDAGSRGYWDIFNKYAAAVNVKMFPVPLPERAQRFMDAALHIALKESRSPPVVAPPPNKRGEPRRGRGWPPTPPQRAPPKRVKREEAPSSSTPSDAEVIKYAPSPRRAAGRALKLCPEDPPPRLPKSSTPSRKAAPRFAASPSSPAQLGSGPLPKASRPRASPSPARDTPSAPVPLPRAHQRHEAPPPAPPRLRSPKRRPSPLRPVRLNAISPRAPAWGGLQANAPRARPATASALYALAARNIADRLAGDDSLGAVCPGDPERLRTLIGDLYSARANARAPSTRNKDEWGYQWWCRCCAALPCDPLRPTDVLYAEREAFIGGFAVMHMAAHMQPRRRSAKKPKHASPLSAWAAYKHARTVLAAWGCKLPDIALVRDTLKGLMRNHMAAYGDEVLAPDRKRPFFRKHEISMLELLNRRGVSAWSPALHEMIKCAVCFARCTGARKAELTIDGGCHFYSRAHLTWYIGRTPVAPTPENIRRATRLRIRPAASKADPFNIHWGSLEMFFNLVDGEHMNVAVALRDMELAYPCSPEERATYPLVFDASARVVGVPPAVSRAWLDHKLRSMLAMIMDPSEAEQRSWHSWRVTLACSLRAARDAKHPDGRSLDLVKVFGRWRSDSAVELYGRLDADAYAGHVSASLAADAASINASGTAEAMDSVDPPLFESMAAEQDDAETDVEADSLSRAEPTAAPRDTPLLPQPPKPARRSAKKSRAAGGRRRAPALTGPPSPSGTKRPRLPKGASRVLVPASCFPEEPCHENGGKGWCAVAVPRKRGTATVTFEAARDADGLPFRPILLHTSA